MATFHSLSTLHRIGLHFALQRYTHSDVSGCRALRLHRNCSCIAIDYGDPRVRVWPTFSHPARSIFLLSRSTAMSSSQNEDPRE